VEIITLEQRIKSVIREVPDFPKPGILFKDIMPIMQDPELCRDITETFCERIRHLNIDALCAIESRGFFFGPMICQRLNIPFIPIRKKGKLPGDTISYSYDLEYGQATVEIHKDVLDPGTRVIVHDDLLATGGTAAAAAELMLSQKAEVVGFSFLVNLSFLKGEERLQSYASDFIHLVEY